MKIFLARLVAVVRILIGIWFVWNGIQMLLDQDLLYGGLLRHLYETGGPVRFYNTLVLPYIERFETPLVILAACSNIVVGILFVTGTLMSLSSLAATFLVVNFGLASSSQNRPREFLFIFITLLLLMLGRMGSGLLWGVDALLIRRFQDWLVLFPLRRKAPQ